MTRRRPVQGVLLKERLDTLVATFDVTTIEPDPLQLVLRYRDPRDQEVAGLVAAAFAYGRAETIVANVEIGRGQRLRRTAKSTVSQECVSSSNARRPCSPEYERK